MIKNIFKYISDNNRLLIRLDDIAENMNWDLMNKCEKLFDKYQIKPILGVIPLNEDSELKTWPLNKSFWESVRRWQSKGWEIAMHGCHHLYKVETNKKDIFNYGGKSEFFGEDLSVQVNKIKSGKNKFNSEQIKIRSFFAPNHTYDKNTFQALKKNEIFNVIDGYGLMPYKKFGMVFIPQLFYKEILIPFGIQCTQIHLNYWKDKDFEIFENFIEKNRKKSITFDEVLDKTNNNLFYSALNIFTEKTLRFLRFFK
tara:strand:+ start:2753 stop:3517 length:765 start_codon:yes stop_codon:yes gene_type:complete